MTSRIWLLVVAAVTCSCEAPPPGPRFYAAPAPPDPYFVQFGQGCHAEAECAAWRDAARARLMTCGRPTPLCQRYQADVAAASRALAFYGPQQRRYDMQQAILQRAEAAQQRRAEEQRVADAARATMEEQRKAQEAAREAEERAADEAAWGVLDVKGCTERADPRACNDIAAFVTSHPTSPHQADAVLALHAGRDRIAAVEAQEVERARRARPAPRAPALPPPDTTPHVCCCDDTVSSCFTPHAGCCDGHDGACPCK